MRLTNPSIMSAGGSFDADRAASNDVAPASRFRPRNAAAIAAIAVVYFGAAKFGLSLAFATQQVTAVWPPTGIGLVALLVLGPRAWPGVFVGAFLANVTSNEPAVVAAGIALGNTLEALTGAYLLRRFHFDRSLAKLSSVLGLIGLAAIASTAVSASIGVANLVLGGIIPWSAVASVWWVWWTGDAMGDLVVAPVLLVWAAWPPIQVPAGRRAELAALLAGVLAVTCVIFSGLVSVSSTRLEYAPFLFLIWAALRFGQREAISAALVVAAVAVWGTIHDHGPFAAGTLDQRLILLDTYVAVTSVTAMLMSAVMGEREHALARVSRARTELEVRVEERTAELARTNTELAAKNEEVEAFVYIVSHDLRAPLVNVQGFARELEISCRELQAQLAGATLPPEIERVVSTIIADDIPGALRFVTAGTTKFQRLIDALLVLSRTGRQQYESDVVDVGAVIGSTIDALRQLIDSSGARVVVGSLPPAQGDVTAVGQIFANLIGNAVKYLQPGRPGVIEIGGERADSGVHYWVRDNGAGIPTSAHARLFQVFQRFHPQLASGDGMGLAIVKRVTERLGGTVRAESTEGSGTTFHVSLPGVESRP